MKTRKHNVKIVNPDTGEVVYEKKGFEAPDFWSDRAINICASKYSTTNEYSAIDIINRVVNQITIWGIEQGYFCDTDDVDETYNPDPLQEDDSSKEFSKKLKDILINQRAAFNSPVWFNCGSKTKSNQMSACFILSVEDDIKDILEHSKREGMIFAGGSGAGINISKLRGEGELLSGGGTSSGPLSFNKGFDHMAGTIKSGGKTRRSARMVCMDVDHPDIMKFIDCKAREEKKAKILMDNGISKEEAYSTVAFQNANHSIRVNNEFMRAVLNKEPWNLIPRKGLAGEIPPIPAKDILRKIAECAWETGDPGLQFHDRTNLDNPVPTMGNIRSGNPCNEFNAIDNSSCNLASLNLVKYYDGETFDWTQFEKDIFVLITAMDILVEGADYPTEEIRETTRRTRPLGLGFSNLGALLMLMNLPYDSGEGRQWASDITRAMTINAYVRSIELAKKLGSFEDFEPNKNVCKDIAKRLTDNSFVPRKIVEFGLRNSQLTLLAPCGTIGFMMDCDTTGIEPLFSLNATKTLSDGSTMKIVSGCAEGVTDKEVLKTANEISWKGHIDMMAACQNHLSSAISKTINMPSDCTIEDIEEAYIYAWKSGLKSITVYRDGSKELQPLTHTQEKEDESHIEHGLTEWKAVRKKLQDTRYDGRTHKFNIGGFKGYITANVYEDGSLGEIFLSGSKFGSTFLGLLNSFATAISLALQYGVPLEHLVEKFAQTRFDPQGITHNPEIRMCSSIIDYMFRWMALEFLEEDQFNKAVLAQNGDNQPQTKTLTYDGPSCDTCGGMTQKSGSCYVCLACGSTTGCS